MLGSATLGRFLSPLGVGSSVEVKPDGKTPENLKNLEKHFAKIGLQLLLVAVVYYVGTLVGFALTPPQEPIAAFWPPNAILLATLLITPRKQWWLLLLAVLPSHLLIQLRRGIPLGTSLGWYFSNTGEALLGAYLITRVQDAKASFERVRGLIVFLAFGVFGAPLFTSFLDAAVVTLTGWGQDYWRLWTTRLLSNMLAELTVVPTIVLLCANGVAWFGRVNWKRYLEAILIASCVVIVSFYDLETGPSGMGQIRLFYMLLLLLSWASIRFGFGGLSGTLLAVSVVSSWNIVHNRGPFASASPWDVMSLQLSLCMVALPSMFLVALLVQQNETAASLWQSRIRLINSQEEERTRIARELHDGVGQSLALMEVELAQLANGSDLQTQARIQQLSQQVAEISQATRELSHVLHPSQLEYLGLSAALERLCGDFTVDRMHVSFEPGRLPARINPDVALSLYRVAQEALHNATKYSKAGCVRVRLFAGSKRLWMDIDDDGVGFSKEEKDPIGIGMLNMRERMELVGGAISIRSAPNRGTHVHASVPLGSAA